MGRTILIYGAILAAGAFVLQWLQFGLMARTHPAEVYVGLIALAYAFEQATRRRVPPPSTP